jgi:hypothetical protein
LLRPNTKRAAPGLQRYSIVRQKQERTQAGLDGIICFNA